MPELESQFSEQLHFIQSTIHNKHSKNSESGGIHITKENVDLWYGAINQGHIAIEQEQKERINDLPDTVCSVINSTRLSNHSSLNTFIHLRDWVGCLAGRLVCPQDRG